MRHIHFIAITIFFTAVLLGVFLLSRRTAVPAHLSDAGSIELLQQNILLQSASFNRLQFNGVDSATGINGTRTAMKDIFNERRPDYAVQAGFPFSAAESEDFVEQRSVPDIQDQQIDGLRLVARNSCLPIIQNIGKNYRRTASKIPFVHNFLCRVKLYKSSNYVICNLDF
jgi:hypothetical protein